MTLINN
jgi:hypothetical protein